jgi:iron complex outermembrane receptor protein
MAATSTCIRAQFRTRGRDRPGLLGNWNSFIGRVEFQTGKIDKLERRQIRADGPVLKSDGALTNSPVMSKNLFFKGVIPIGDSNTLTVLRPGTATITISPTC